MRKIRGIHPPPNKNTEFSVPERIPVPAEVHIPMLMHAGRPAVPVVKVGDEVKVGQLIGEASGAVSADVHASVSGKVKSINDRDPITGQKAVSITIASDGNQTIYEGLRIPTVTTREELIQAVKESGVVGLGGAGFPTAPKLTFSSKLDFILINGAECEPYVTSDTRTMIDDAEYVAEGVRLLQKYYEPKEMIICIEDNKPEAIAKMRECHKNDKGIRIEVMPTAYPMGERKVQVFNVVHRTIMEGTRLHESGCIVSNCTTVAVFAKYIKTGMPLVEKVVTVDGSSVKTPKNVIAPIGTPIKELFEYCGGFVGGEPKRIITGGAMMGFAVPSLDVPVVKISNCILALQEKDVPELTETKCIRCGRCVSNCPMNLMPPFVEREYLLNRPDRLDRFKVNMCVECGCCAYVCPAKRQLVQVMQLANNMVWEYKEEQKAAEKAAAEKAAAEQAAKEEAVKVEVAVEEAKKDE